MEANLRFEFNQPTEQNQSQKVEVEILKNLDQIDEELFKIDEKLISVGEDIDKLTSHADWLDVTSAVISGLLMGAIDNIFIDDFNFEVQKKNSDEKQTLPLEKVVKNFTENATKNDKISNLIKKFVKDEDLQKFNMPDLSCHPSILGLVCAILTQLTERNYGIDKNGLKISEIKEKTLIGKTIVSKLFLAIIFWLLDVLCEEVKPKCSQKDDEEDSKPWLLKLLLNFPFFKDVVENGIDRKELKIIVAKLFNGELLKKKGKEPKTVAVEEEKETLFSRLAKQSLPVVINEVSVRGMYFIKQLRNELKEKKALGKVDWQKLLPFGNRTIERMMTIASGVFTATDIVGAMVLGATSTLHSWKKGLTMGINIPGVCRFVLAGITDIGMGIKRGGKESELTHLKNQALCLMNAKLYYGETLLWQAQKDANQSIGALFDALEQNSAQIMQDLNDSQESAEEIKKIDLQKADKQNAGLLDDIFDVI